MRSYNGDVLSGGLNEIQGSIYADGGGTEEPPPPPPPDGEVLTDEEIAAYVAFATGLPEDHYMHDGSQMFEMTAYWGGVRNGVTYPGLLPRTGVNGPNWISVKDGDWEDVNVWSTRTVPTDEARVLISRGTEVTLNGTTARLNWIRVDGKFIKNPAVNTKVYCRDQGVDKAGVLEEGTASQPIAAGVTCETAFICDSDIDVVRDPLLMGRGMIMEGMWTFYGATKTTHVPVSAHPMIGATTISLASAPTGWRVGDFLVITGTHHANVPDGDLWENRQDEELEIVSISGTTLTFRRWGTLAGDSAAVRGLQYNHDGPRSTSGTMWTPGSNPTRAYVINHTRNLKYYSEGALKGLGYMANAARAYTTTLNGTNADYYGDPGIAIHRRAHVMVMHSKYADGNYASFDFMGRTRKDVRSWNSTDPNNTIKDLDGSTLTIKPFVATSNVRGRYNFHLHRAGYKWEEEGCPVTGEPLCLCERAIFTGLTGMGSPGWIFAHHNSNAEFRECAAYYMFGTGFAAEEGGATGDWIGNIAGHALRGGGMGEKDAVNMEPVNDHARIGYSFWFGSRNVGIYENVAYGNQGSYIWNGRGDNTGSGEISPTPVSSLDEPLIAYGNAEDAFSSDRVPIKAFEKNISICSIAPVDVIKRNPTQDHDKRTLMKEFFAWETRGRGLGLTYTGSYTVLKPDLVGDDRSGTGIEIEQSVDMVIIDPWIENFKDGFSMNMAPKVTDNKTYLLSGGTVRITDMDHLLINPTFVNIDRYEIWSSDATPGEKASSPLALTALTDTPLVWDPVLFEREVTALPLPGRITVAPINDVDPRPNGVLRYESGFNKWTGSGDFDLNGPKRDGLLTKQRCWGQMVQKIDVNQMTNLIIANGYYTDSSIGGSERRYVVIDDLIGDRATGDYIKFQRPIWLDFATNSSKWLSILAVWGAGAAAKNLGQLPAAMVAKIPVGSVWTEGDSGIPRIPHP